MSPQPAGPRVVAELGRPETPEETAARKAENSRNHRRRQTINNLVFSLLATLALVAVIVLMVPRADAPQLPDVDFSQAAVDAQASRDEILANPKLPDTWSSNYAELRTKKAPGISTWNIGLLTPGDEQRFIGITQGFGADATWQSNELKNSLADTIITIDGIEWTVYDNRDNTEDMGNVHYALVTESGTSTFILFGTGTDKEFTTVAKAIADQVEANEKIGD